MAYDNVTPLREQKQRPVREREAEPAAAAPFSLRDQLLKLKRRKWIILAVLLLGTIGAVVAAERIEPQYRASAYVMLEARREQTVDIERVLSDVPVDLETIQSEIAVITSRGLARKVIADEGLDTVPEFNPRLASAEEGGVPNPIDLARGALDAALRLVGVRGAEPDVRDPALIDRQNEIRIVNSVLGRLEARPRGRSRVIEIAFTSEDPERAARVANAFADAYILEQLEAGFDATQRATQWLNERLAQLRTQTEQAERRAEEYRQEAGLLQGDGATTLAQQSISRLNAELIDARSALTTAEARLRQAEPAIGSGVRTLPGAVLENPLIQTVQGEVITLQRQLAELRETFGPRHPTLVNARAELGEAQARLGAEIGKVISALRNDVAVARTRVDSLTAALQTQERQAGVLGQREVQLRSLESEADANRQLLNQLTQRFNETAIQQDLQQPEARVISEAPVPQQPSYPQKSALVGVAAVLSGLLGVALALVVEHLDHGFRSAEQLTRSTRLPTLGMIPAARGWRRRRRPQDEVVDKPRSSYAEAVSSTLASLFLATDDRRPKLVLVTSTLPGEGKTTLALSLARAASQSGLKVLLVDVDLRRPALHGALGQERQPGFTDLLAERAEFAQAVRQDPKTGVEFMPAGSAVQNPLHFLAAERTRQFLHGLTKYYDLIVLDSSPVMAVSDPRILSRYVDRTMFVVRWAKTRREQAMNALDQIAEAGGTVAGTVLTQVDVRRHAQYSFGDSGAYHVAARYYET